MDKIRDNLLHVIIMAVFVVALIAVLVVGAVIGGSHKSALDAQAQEMVGLQNQIETQRAQVSAGSGAVVQATTGIDLDRKAKDDAVIKEFANKVMTWHSFDEYTEMRSEVLEKYSLSAASRFASVFLPDYGTVSDADGVEYNLIDYAKISCEYRGMKSIVSGINNAYYNYFVIVTCAGSRDGAGSTFNVILTCTVDGAGSISNLEAYTLS